MRLETSIERKEEVQRQVFQPPLNPVATSEAFKNRTDVLHTCQCSKMGIDQAWFYQIYQIPGFMPVIPDLPCGKTGHYILINRFL